MSYRERWIRKHVATYDGRLLRQWEECSRCHRFTTHYLVDGHWICHRAVMRRLIEAGAEGANGKRTHA